MQYYHFCDISKFCVLLLLHADVGALTTRMSEMLSLKLLLPVVAELVFYLLMEANGAAVALLFYLLLGGFAASPFYLLVELLLHYFSICC